MAVGSDHLTPEFLTEVLRAKGILANGSVLTCESEPLSARSSTGQSFTGQFRRLSLDYDADEPDAPHSLVAKSSSADAEVRAIVWPAFLAKLSIPMTKQIRQAADWITEEVSSTLWRQFHEPPLTVIHHAYQADNLVFDVKGDGRSLAVLDWQMHVRGRGPMDLAYFLSGSLNPDLRSRSEHALIARYAAQLKAKGVEDYGPEQCLDDYREALILPPARLAVAVATNPEMTRHEGAHWDVVFDRQIRALHDNRP